jgi:hypothetical protein
MRIVLDVEGAFVPAASSVAGRFRSVLPLRVLDTRTNGIGRLGPSYWLTFHPTSTSGSPVKGAVYGVSAAVFRITVIAPYSAGRTAVFPYNPNATSDPLGVSVYSPAAGRTASNLVVVRTPSGQFPTLKAALGAGGYLVVDLVGWFTDATGAAGSDAVPPPGTDGLFVPLAPWRAADKTAAAASTTAVTLVDGTHVPTSAVRAVVTNLTESNATKTGTVTAYPATAWRTATYSGWIDPSVTQSGLDIPQLGTNGRVNVYASVAARLRVDAVGYFTSPPPMPSTLPTAQYRLLYLVASDQTADKKIQYGIWHESELINEWLRSQTVPKGLRWRIPTNALGFPVVSVVHLSATRAQLDGTEIRDDIAAAGYPSTDGQTYVAYIEAIGGACGDTDAPTAVNEGAYAIDYMP